MTVNERELILEGLLLITKDGEYLSEVLNGILDKYAFLEKRQRSFISREITGVVERMIELDARINDVSSKPVNKLKPVIRTLLRMGAFEIYYMDKVPESATCNEIVKLAKKRGFASLSGYVNGNLRALARKPKEALALSDAKKLSLPDFVFDSLVADYGRDKAIEIGECFLKEAPLYVRSLVDTKVNIDKSQEITSVCGIGLKNAYRLDGVDRLDEDEAFLRGDFYVQDLSSQAAVSMAGIEPGDKVLDVCAAPGGKSILAATLAGPKGSVLSRDLTEEKVQKILDNKARLHISNLSAEVFDASVFDEKLAGKFDVVICDLPCSGLGVIGKKPDIKLRIKEEDLESLAAIQRELLEVCHRYVKPDGTLMYSTCTINRTENEDQVTAFLEKHDEYELFFEQQLLPEKDLCNDGFYVAVMKRYG